jgi:uncharacterized protein
MKILAISDEVVDWIYSPHLLQRCGDIDLVVGCGDLPIHYMEYVTSMLNVPCYFVRGNHDLYEISESGELKTEPQGWINLDMRRVRHGGISLAGLQGSIRYKPHVPMQYTQREQWLRAAWLARKLLRPRMSDGRGVDILVAHAPPYGIHDGPDHAHTGFEALNWLIGQFRPRFLLHGHQHRNYAPLMVGETQVDDTLVLNVHPFRIIEL